jgi:hypothetical protein
MPSSSTYRKDILLGLTIGSALVGLFMVIMFELEPVFWIIQELDGSGWSLARVWAGFVMYGLCMTCVAAFIGLLMGLATVAAIDIIRGVGHAIASMGQPSSAKKTE